MKKVDDAVTGYTRIAAYLKLNYEWANFDIYCDAIGLFHGILAHKEQLKTANSMEFHQVIIDIANQIEDHEIYS